MNAKPRQGGKTTKLFLQQFDIGFRNVDFRVQKLGFRGGALK
jgi:hypothetical protein